MHKHPCHCCNVVSDELHVPSNLVDCKFCKEYGENIPVGHKCYHHEFLSESHIDGMKIELEEVQLQLQEQFTDVAEVQTQSLLRTDEDPREQSATAGTSRDNISSIHFAYQDAERLEVDNFSNKVAHDLTVHNIDVLNNELEGWVS